MGASSHRSIWMEAEALLPVIFYNGHQIQGRSSVKINVTLIIGQWSGWRSGHMSPFHALFFTPFSIYLALISFLFVLVSLVVIFTAVLNFHLVSVLSAEKPLPWSRVMVNGPICAVPLPSVGSCVGSAKPTAKIASFSFFFFFFFVKIILSQLPPLQL